jgi:anti-sigma factor ChrR (cupin superfamily)
MKPEFTHRDEHLNESEIAAYIDGVLSVDERTRAERHLSMCDECRLETLTSGDAVGSAPSLRPRSRSASLWLGVAAAAGLAVVAASTLSRNAADREIVRADSASVPMNRATVAVVAPADGASLARDGRLVWRGFGADATYRLTIADESAQPLYSATVQDTSVALPSSVQPTPGKKFFWYVDAIGPDGLTASSGLKSFTVE